MILVTKKTKDYELIDSGEGEKLERFGEFVLRRPDPQAIWKKNLTEDDWNSDARFIKNWQGKKISPWSISLDGLNFELKLSSFKHVGVFPEQIPNWQWIRNVLSGTKNTQILNLFGYTGGATLACLQAGSAVVHVDASKVAISTARKNATLSQLDKKPVRWILEDASSFLKKEIRRGKKYNGIIMDPPIFGRGPKGEVWKIEKDFLPFLRLCRDVLDKNYLFVLINGYASGYSSIAYENALRSILSDGMRVESGELSIEDGASRLLPAGIFARGGRVI